MSISRRAVIASTLGSLLATNVMPGEALAASQERPYKYWDFSASISSQTALDRFSDVLNTSMTVPVFVVAYDSTESSTIKKIYLEEMIRVLERRGYGRRQNARGESVGAQGLLISVDLSKHASLPLGHKFTIDGIDKMVPFLATSIFFEKIADSKVITTFYAANKKGEKEKKLVIGIADIPAEGMSEAAFRDQLFTRMTILYDRTQKLHSFGAPNMNNGP